MSGKIKTWQKKIRGGCCAAEALSLADSFSKACVVSKKIPMWALALRALAGRVRMQKRRIEQLEEQLLHESYTP